MNTDKIYAEKIASEYAEEQTNKVKALKRLDKRAKRPAQIFSYIFGACSALLLGVGMCFSMNIIGNGASFDMALGVIIGIVGIFFMSVNYSCYSKIIKKSKKRYASDIISLAKQISEE